MKTIKIKQEKYLFIKFRKSLLKRKLITKIMLNGVNKNYRNSVKKNLLKIKFLSYFKLELKKLGF